MTNNDGGREMSTPLKGLVYGAFSIVAVFLVLNFIASRMVIPLKQNWSIAKTIKSLFGSIMYVKFLTPSERRRVFVRSAIPTPAQYFDSIPGEKVINGDTRVERRHGGEGWDEIRRSIYERDEYTCQICGVQGGSGGVDVVLQADHILPRSRGGEDDPENLRTLCRTCHQARHARRF